MRRGCVLIRTIYWSDSGMSFFSHVFVIANYKRGRFLCLNYDGTGHFWVPVHSFQRQWRWFAAYAVSKK